MKSLRGLFRRGSVLRTDPGDEPTRLAHLDDGNERDILL
jgi:hypothetical protein